jgi:type II secretion system (T2SS) protein E/PilZ domain-containing protein
MGEIIRKHRKLGEILADMGVISRHELEHFFRTRMQPGLFLGDQLVRSNLITPEDLARALARQFGLVYVNLRVTPPDPEVIPSIRVETAERYLTVPYQRDAAALQVATALPQRRGLIDALESESGYTVKVAVASRPGIEQAIRNGYRSERQSQRLIAGEEASVTLHYLDLGARLAPREERRITILNLSETGACLQVSCDPAIWSPDEPLRLDIRVPGATEVVSCRVVKRWANPAPPPAYGWRVGLEFLELKADARLVLGRWLAIGAATR